jgi:uncharacterized membrane protein YgcG
MLETINQSRRQRRRRTVAIGAVLVVTGTLGIAAAQRRVKQFTPDDVNTIATSLRSARDEAIYLVRLPVFKDGRVVGSKLHGTLPMKEVEQLAASLNIRLDKNANVLAVFDPNDGDDTGGSTCGGSMCGAQGGSGGGGGSGGRPDEGSDVNEPGSMYPANGRDLSIRLESILVDIDVSSYQFLR